MDERNKFMRKCEACGKFNDKQINEIWRGCCYGLTIEQLKLVANPKFDEEQMFAICNGFDNGLTTNQVKVYAKPQFRWNEMFGIQDYLNKTGRTSLSEKECRFLIGIGEIDTDYIWRKE